MTPRRQSILAILTLSLWVVLAAFQFLSGMYRTESWFMTFMLISLPLMLSLVLWSLRRETRPHPAGNLVVAGTRLAIEVSLAMMTMFMWIGFATYAALRGLPGSVSLWVVLAVFFVWLVWFASTIRRARGYAFMLRPEEIP